MDYKEILASIEKDVELQKKQALKELENTKDYTITIDSFVKSMCYKKYANKLDRSGDIINIDIDEEIQVSVEDFIEDQFMFTEFSEELEKKYDALECLDDLRDAQREAIEELTEQNRGTEWK